MRKGNKMFCVNTLYIDKFKAFNKIKLEFNKKLTVIVGENGTGKTTIQNDVKYIDSCLKYIDKLPKEAIINLKEQVIYLINKIEKSSTHGSRYCTMVKNNFSDRLKKLKILLKSL